MDLLGDGRAAEHVALLEDEHPAPGAREVGRAGQAVVSPPDDDGVVGLRHFSPDPEAFFRGGSKNGSLTTVAGTE